MIRLLTQPVFLIILFISILTNVRNTSPEENKKSISIKHAQISPSESSAIKTTSTLHSEIVIDPSNILGFNHSNWTNPSNTLGNAGSMDWKMTGTSSYSSADHFITTWKTNNAGSSHTTSITIPIIGGHYDVSWKNDGVWENGFTGDATHDYGTAGTYTVAVRGDFPRIMFIESGDNKKILSIEQWGTNVWKSMAWAFVSCTNLVGNATDAPNLSQVSAMTSMFYNASKFNQNIGNWDVSNVTDMAQMFSYAKNFNQNIGNWNVSNVTNMFEMFAYAGNFNQDINNWNVSNVTNMMSMFRYARSFNGNIGNWKVDNVTNMTNMFYSANDFNQDISKWNVSGVTNMTSMFLNANSFNSDIGKWNVSKVTNMSNMFYFAENFNQNIGNWNVSKVTNMTRMLYSVPLSTTNYDALLKGWSKLTLQPNVNFNADESKYCSAQAARDTIINTFGWTITDAGIGNPPVAKAKNIIVTLDANGNATITPNDMNLDSSLGCSGAATLSISKNTFNCSNIGPNSVTLTIMDVNGNQSMSTATVTVTDNLAPIPDVGNLIDITKKCEVHITDVPQPTASDNCSATVSITTDAIFPITTVGTHTITWTYTDIEGNSRLQTQNIIVLPSDLDVVTFPNSRLTYNGAGHNLEVVGLPSAASVSYDNNNQTEAGDYLVTATVSSTGTNCPDIILTATLSIERAQAMITATSPQPFIYDGLVKNVFASLDNTEGSLNYAPTQGYSDVGNYPILVYSNETNNYLAASKNLSLVITPATISGITLNDDSFVFDENSKSLAISGVLPTGTSVSYGNNSRTDVGTQEVIATISGANYRDLILTANLTITPATISGLTLNNDSFVFDENSKSLAISGVLPTGTSMSYGNNSRTDVGTQEVIATISGANYFDLILTANLTITPGTISGITFNDDNFVFDENSKSLAISGILPTGTSVSYVHNSRTEVGTQEVTATISGANYSDLILTADLTITPATISGITFNDDSFVFDKTSKSLAISGILPTGTSVSYGNNSRTDVGTQEVTATISGVNNFDLILTANLSISPKTLMIAAYSNQEKTYGDTDPVFTYTHSGLEPGDAETVISGALSRVTGENVGTYPIQLGTLNAGVNYAIDFISADFKVLIKELVITVNPNQFKIYGSSDPLLTATYMGFANGDNETSLNGSLNRIAGEDAGMYPIILGSLTAGANYNITFNSLDFEIRKAEQTINWNQLLEFGCDIESQITLTSTTNSGLPVTYSVSNASIATINGDLLTIIGLGNIQVSAIQEGNQNYNPAPILKRTVIIKKSGLIRQHWTDVLVLDNSNETLVSYQWFKNGLPISGATKQYYNENAALNGSYYAEATTKTGEVITSCSLELSGLSFTQEIKIFPNPVKSGAQFTLECSFEESALNSANIQIYDLSGKILNSIPATGVRTQLTAQLPSGIYVVSLNLSNGIRKTVNLLVK